MARYTGPKAKISRKFGEPILGQSKALQRKNYAPGQHGKGRKRKMSEYAVQLSEKQKAKFIYGVLERQFAKTFSEAARMGGVTGLNLLQLLESIIDNVVYRLGLASTRRQARQLVLHGHFTINGHVVNIPSIRIKVGDIVAIRERSKSLEVISENVSVRSSKKHPWLEWDDNLMAAKMIAMPDREQITENINEQLIVELYSK
ncbi:MAG: 30S ribosomal protein S4 [Cytophagales bacterium]